MWVCRILKKKVQQGDIQEKERAAKRESLREKKTVKRELCVEKKIERRVQSIVAFERYNLCV